MPLKDFPRTGFGDITLDATDVGVSSANSAVPGIPLVHRITIPDAATGSVDVVVTHKIRVLDAWIVKTEGNGASGNSYQIKNGNDAISDAIDGNVNDTAIARAATINDATYGISAGGTLRVTRTRAGGNAAAIVCVLCVRVA
jgi:hypothetical protein